MTMLIRSAVDFSRKFFELNPTALSLIDLFEALPTAFFYVKDLESRFVKVNRAFMLSHGVSVEDDIIGKTDRDFSPPAFAEAYIAEDLRVMRGRVPIPGQLWMVFHPGNRPNWYISTKVPLFSPAGEVVGIAGAMYAIDQAEEKERYFGALNPAIRHLEQHFSDAISMDEMAKLAKLSSTHFNRRFQQLLRSTPTEYLRTVRVQTAAKLLSGTQKSLVDIAVETGFTDQSHFTRCFHKSTGLTPRDYRLRFQKM